MADDGEAESPLPRFGSKRCSSCLSYFKLRLALHSFIHSLAVDSWAAACSSCCLLQLLPPSLLSYWVLASSWLLYAENFYSKGQITKFFITWFFPMFIIIYSKGFNLSFHCSKEDFLWWRGSLSGLNGIPGAQSSRTLCFSSYLPRKYVDQRKNIKTGEKIVHWNWKYLTWYVLFKKILFLKGRIRFGRSSNTINNWHSYLQSIKRHLSFIHFQFNYFFV